MLHMPFPVKPKRWHPPDFMLHTTQSVRIRAALVIGRSQHRGIILLTDAAKFSLHDTSACMPKAPSAGPPPSLAALRTNQPRAQGIDAPDRFGRSFLVRPVEFAGDRHRADFTESQIPPTSTTAEGADAAQIRRLFVKQAGVSKVHFSGSLRLTFIDRGALTSPANSDAKFVLMPVVP
jgi:hypothetical protein